MSISETKGKSTKKKLRISARPYSETGINYSYKGKYVGFSFFHGGIWIKSLLLRRFIKENNL